MGRENSACDACWWVSSSGVVRSFSAPNLPQDGTVTGLRCRHPQLKKKMASHGHHNMTKYVQVHVAKQEKAKMCQQVEDLRHKKGTKDVRRRPRSFDDDGIFVADGLLAGHDHFGFFSW